MGKPVGVYLKTMLGSQSVSHEREHDEHRDIETRMLRETASMLTRPPSRVFRQLVIARCNRVVITRSKSGPHDTMSQ
jgi:hypothetical protein